MFKYFFLNILFVNFTLQKTYRMALIIQSVSNPHHSHRKKKFSAGQHTFHLLELQRSVHQRPPILTLMDHDRRSHTVSVLQTAHGLMFHDRHRTQREKQQPQQNTRTINPLMALVIMVLTMHFKV